MIPSPPAIDHVVLLVRDLERATTAMEMAGYEILQRADRAEKPGSSFRFVSFPDGSYILLNAFSDEAAKKHRLGPILDEREGWGDWSVVVGDLDAAIHRARAAGIVLGPENKVANTLSTGEPWGLRLLQSGRGSGGDPSLPFLVQDVEGRSARIPGPTRQPSGATAISGLRIASDTPLESAGRLAVLVGLEAPTLPELRIGTTTVAFVATDPSASGTARLGGPVGITVTGTAGATHLGAWPFPAMALDNSMEPQQ